MSQCGTKYKNVEGSLTILGCGYSTGTGTSVHSPTAIVF